MMKKFDLTEFEIEEEDLKLRLKRKGDEVFPAPAAGYSAPPFPVAASAPAAPAPESAPAPAAEEAPGKVIKSPMVGTFYRAPSPESAEFVKPGDKVEETTVVCIVEAMKVMNEIQAEVRGTIKEALVENGASVEYGQPLFKLA